MKPGPRKRLGARAAGNKGTRRKAGGPAHEKGGRKKAASRGRDDMPLIWVASAMPGTEDLLKAEIKRRFAGKARFVASQRQDEHHFVLSVKPAQLQELALCHALHVRRDYAVIRPRGLLSPEHLRDMAQQMRNVMAMAPGETFHGFRFDAAGANSPTFQRLAQNLSQKLHLRFDPDEGDCVVAVRPGQQGWEVLCRVGRRPLSTRSWRQANYRGSLNANFAAAMVELSRPQPGERLLNLMCGSGTILLEAMQRQRLRGSCGIDNDAVALEAARINTRQAKVPARWLQGDARRLPFDADSFDIICADLPWGQAHGRRADNKALYGDALTEARRVSRASGRLVILTQDSDSLAAAASSIDRCWQLTEERTFVQRGFRPACRVYVRR